MKTLSTKLGEVNIFGSKEALASSAAAHFVDVLGKAIQRDGRATVALSGGSSPPLMYERLLNDYADDLPWDKIHFFVGDERCVSHESTDSNWGTAYRLLLSKLPIPESNLHPTEGQDSDPRASAEQYQSQIRSFFGTTGNAVPSFDLIHLGMGPDGHTASLFPNTKGLNVADRLVIDNYVERMTSHRLTFTFPFINAARSVMFMVQGAEKSHVLQEALESDELVYPVQRIKPHGQTTWFVDDAAARDLSAPATK